MIEGPFFYVYRFPINPHGMEYAVQHSSGIGRTTALFALAVDCQTFVDALRVRGETVSIMPTAEGVVS